MAKYIIDVPDEQQYTYDKDNKVLSFVVTEKNGICDMTIEIDAELYIAQNLNVTKNNSVHLCNSCNRMHSLVPCPADNKDVLYGEDRKSVCCCKLYKPDTAVDCKTIEDAQEEAWKTASNCLWNMTNSQSRDIFGMDCVYVPRDMSYQEVKNKLEAWNKRKDVICVGDEVIDEDGDKGVVTFVSDNKYLCDAIFSDGCVIEDITIKTLKKTGRHFDEVEELLKKMRGNHEPRCHTLS